MDTMFQLIMIFFFMFTRYLDTKSSILVIFYSIYLNLKKNSSHMDFHVLGNLLIFFSPA